MHHTIPGERIVLAGSAPRGRVGFVHADLALRRVVETPGRPQAIVSIWRAED